MDSFSKLLASARKAPTGQDGFIRLTSPEEYLNNCQINLTKAYKSGGSYGNRLMFAVPKCVAVLPLSPSNIFQQSMEV